MEVNVMPRQSDVVCHVLSHDGFVSMHIAFRQQAALLKLHSVAV